MKRVYVQGDAPYRVRTERHRPMVRAQQPGRNGAVQLVRANVVEDDADQPVALPGLSFLRAAGTRGAGRELGRGDGHHDRPCLAGPRHQRGLGRTVLPGAAFLGPGAHPLQRRPDRRLPLPRRALRKLVGSGRGDARHSARPCGVDFRGDFARPAERRVSPGRPASRRWACRRRTRS